ncbi:metallophosphoesterase family protein [Paucibacter soli]|uniref:metallophosphoesterase family protein n=1 Tax=Paucibacter soli TaxID=3133433 RepID=UPI0030ADEF4C
MKALNILPARITAVLAAALLAVLAGCAQTPLQGIDDQAWVQAVAGGWMVRANTAAANCPTLSWEGGALPMRLRAAPATLPARKQRDGKPAVFSRRSCELEVPAGARALRVGSQALRAPLAEPRRIVLLGDTGCRLKAADQAFQDCHDPQAWPYAAVIRQAVASQPDLVIHVGDMHYRESPCPAGKQGCAGSPWGYGEDSWQADFFAPSAPLLAAAPWVMVRGNHEGCARAGLGWFRYLDARAWNPAINCEDPGQDAESDFTPPFALPLDARTQLIVFDSSAVLNRAYQAGDAALQRYTAQLREVEQLAKARAQSFFLNHHPVLAFSVGNDGTPKPGSAGMRSALAALQPQRYYPPGVNLVMNGHEHLFEAIGFASDHPGTLVLGNSGSANGHALDEAKARQAQPAPGAVVQSFASHGGYGFATLDRQGEQGWLLTAWSVDGQALKRCDIEASRVSCRDVQ